ncbi:MAG: ribbon-helix-helix protein, CopG family [Candidatus Cloacimonetes bacterium]|nr:ribbon-helix-helix protein, CopG family [Candidatus Cloacimonadota bacterium]
MDILTLKVPEIIKTQLNNLAKKQGLSKSDIVRKALVEYFSKDKVLLSGSFFDLAEDLAGSIKAPSDLSTSKSHLEGYGS